MPEHDPKRIDALLRRAGAEAAGRLHWFAETASTNDWLLAQADVHARACLAEAQSAGRGRRGRAWRTAPSGAVLLSLGWSLGGAAADGLSLLSGLAAVDALRRAGVGGVGLKWPNDLMAGGKKLGGVLVELRGGDCVIGLGVNVMMPPMARESTNLQALGYEIDRDALAAGLIISHCSFLRRFCSGGFAQFAGEWQRLNVHRDRAVSVESPRETFHGVARGIDAAGALLVEQFDAQGQAGHVRRVIAGEVSLRGCGR